MPIQYQNDNLFHSYFNEVYCKVANAYNLPNIGPLICPIKLHISVQSDNFNNHWEAIRDLLKPYVESGVISGFKVVDNSIFNEKFFNDFSQLEKLRSDPNEFNSQSSFFIDLCLANKVTPDHAGMKAIYQKFIEISRFYHSDQFTIYIPKNYNAQQITMLCASIEKYIKDNQLKSGNLSDVAVPLTKHINVRQEYLNEDTNYLSRINAIKCPEDNDAIRVQVIQEIKKHPLFAYLSTNMLLANISQNANAFWASPTNNQTSQVPHPEQTSTYTVFSGP